MLVAVYAVLGLLLGSFANAAIWRLKVKKSIINDRSECPNCHHKLSALDLVPVLSWLALKGKCRYCKKPISVQYPLVELVMSGLFVWSYLTWDFHGTFSQISFGLWLPALVALVILAVYDLKWLIIPEILIRVLAVIALAMLIVSLFYTQPSSYIGSRILAALAGGGFFYLMYALGKGRWMGGGDVKLAFVMGLLLGLSNLLVAMLVAFNSAALISLVLLAIKKVRRKAAIPFGPFLVFGTIFAMLYGSRLFNAYLDYFLLR